MIDRHADQRRAAPDIDRGDARAGLFRIWLHRPPRRIRAAADPSRSWPAAAHF
jgi:hypothetical protein